MTEVPEHLLRRSRERKAQAAGEASGAAEGQAPATDTAAKSSAVEPASGAAPAAAGGGAPAKPAEPAYTGPPQPPEPKRRIPMWAMPVVAGLPFWAMLYAGAFGERAVEAEGPVAAGAAVYANCSGCHGNSGEGGLGPAMDNVNTVFPNFADHVAWVREGSIGVQGQNYGAGGQGNGGQPATGGMPGFADSLSEDQIIAVVCHERVTLAGGEVPPECEEGAEPDAGEGTGSGEEAEGGGGDAGVTAGGEGGG